MLSKQVQLLVSDADVESYKQIKSDLDVLRQSVEKSELWVYKSNKSAAATVVEIPSTSNDQEPSPVVPDLTPVAATSSTSTTGTTLSHPVIEADSHSTTLDQPASTTGDTSATDSGGGGEFDDEDEDDEYKKIQKVTKMLNICFFSFL